MTGAGRDPRVDDFLAALPDWQAELAAAVRECVHAADPDVEETIKRTRLPFFVLEGNIAALMGTKDHLNVFVYDPTVESPLVNQGHGNRTAKAVQLYRGDAVDSDAFVALFAQVIAHNRAGGWRQLAR